MGDYRERKYSRIEVDATVDFENDDSLTLLLFHKIENISLGGICIKSPTPEPVGSIVDVAINLPDTEEELCLRGEVVWTRKDVGEMGIKFLDITDEIKAKLRSVVKREIESPEG